MNKDDWKGFLSWLDTATDKDLERKQLVLSAMAETFREEGSRADAKKMLRQITLEIEARRSLG